MRERKLLFFTISKVVLNVRHVDRLTDSARKHITEIFPDSNNTQCEDVEQRSKFKCAFVT